MNFFRSGGCEVNGWEGLIEGGGVGRKETRGGFVIMMLRREAREKEKRKLFFPVSRLKDIWEKRFSSSKFDRRKSSTQKGEEIFFPSSAPLSFFLSGQLHPPASGGRDSPLCPRFDSFSSPPFLSLRLRPNLWNPNGYFRSRDSSRRRRRYSITFWSQAAAASIPPSSSNRPRRGKDS